MSDPVHDHGKAESGGAECTESPTEHQQVEDQGEGQIYPFDSLAVEYYEDSTSEPQTAIEPQVAIAEEPAYEALEPQTTIAEEEEEEPTYEVLEPQTTITEQPAYEGNDEGNNEAFQPFEPEVQVNEGSYNAEELQKTYLEDLMYSGTSSFDEASNSTFDETREEPKGSPLGRFSKIVKAVEIAEYETLQVLYQLLYQRSAWDTQQILAQRILEFSGFDFNEKSEDYFNREMMLQTQPNEILVKIGALLGLHQIQKVLYNMENGRSDLILSIMYFLSTPNKKTHLGVKYDNAENTTTTTQGKTPSKCGCRNRCFRKFSQAQQKRILEYMKELDSKKLGDKYLLSLIECKKIVKGPAENSKKFKEVAYEYKCKYGKKQAVVCKGAFVTFHAVKISRMNQLQLKLKAGKVSKTLPDDFPSILPEEEVQPEVVKPVEAIKRTPVKIIPPQLEPELMEYAEDEEINEEITVVMLLWHFLELLDSDGEGKIWGLPLDLNKKSFKHLKGFMDDLKTDPSRFFNYCKMKASTFEYILQLISPRLKRQNIQFRNSITPEERLLVTLRFLATGDSSQKLQFHHQVGARTAAKIVAETCTAIWQVLSPIYLMSAPSTAQWRCTAERFEELWNFPNCCGAIGGKQVSIKSSWNSKSVSDQETFSSMILQALVDAEGKFLIVDAGEPGKNSESVFRSSTFGRMFNGKSLNLPKPRTLYPDNDTEFPYVFVSDEAYTFHKHMMKPYSKNSITKENRIYNYRHSRARRIADCAFSLMTNKFRVFEIAMVTQPDVTKNIILACCVLHNVIRVKEGQICEIYDEIMSIDENCENEQEERVTRRKKAKTATGVAFEVRENFQKYFNSPEGAVPWQDKMSSE